ncbi:SDR family oxidoreductase [Paraburkholderia sp. Ac-20336]|uniref:SDR family NAD(P)-dependent oxidoreductase n=1 Tax=Burkholderiaceae TaxID=119060 RepID=UPI00141ED0E3|nr:MULTISPECIES: SDR family NAD(P)-dependent oxidoreductase [Burkholderiaceae]MBN3806801.1 SDR family oxidoreductase [Paraburkholderia sp. Ac-20336]MBN3849809.1 SDR family oxidoreductase [Paraburkholderia sp. Ac-20342]NIF54798.1 SDR family oxidoreductase [Burkholderia sp. Ax-1724]NIF77150.1 SDR family oxidoreductase [Paraburkholderia sp. Cy-641]
MSHSFDGQVAIVTGAARGIGLGIARQLKADGARVAIWDLDVSHCDAAQLGFEPDHLQSVDVSSYASVESAFEATVAALGHVDILVNNAGINGPVVPSWEYPVETWQRVLDVDLNSVFYGCRVAVPHMRARGGGRILNVASIAGKEGVQFISAYSAAKAGVIGFTKAVAKELARDNVMINCIAPAMVETELFREMSPEHIEASKAKIPLGRFLQIEEVGRMVSWIVSPACSFTTGFTFDLTGGRATY